MIRLAQHIDQSAEKRSILMLAHLIQIAEWVTDIAFPGALLSGPATFSALPRIASVAPSRASSLVALAGSR